MNDRQQRFVNFYFECGCNATRAAEKAGYGTPNQRGNELKSNPEIRAEIERRLAEHTMSANAVLHGLSEIASGDMADFVDLGTPSRDYPNALQAKWSFNFHQADARGKMPLIKSIKETEHGTGIELYDKKGALDTLAKYHKLLTDRVEHDFSKMTDAEIVAIVKEAEGIEDEDLDDDDGGGSLNAEAAGGGIEMKRRGLTLNSPYRVPKDYSVPPKWFHEGQRRLWASDALDTVACAGTQGGKTKSEPVWLLREIQRCAPLIKALGSGKFIFAGPTLTLLKAQAIPHFKELFQEQEQLGRLIEGNQPVFRFSSAGLKKVLGFTDCPVTVHFAYTKDSSNLESMTALAGVWDEAGQKENKQDSYEAYNRRLTVARSTTLASLYNTAPGWWRKRYADLEAPTATFGRRLWGTTPYEWNWFKHLVVDKAEKGEGGFKFFNWPSWLNPLVSEAECRSKLDNGMALWRWLMMYLGQFTRPAGVIYDTFDWDLDTCEDFLIPPTWPDYLGLDFGQVNMAGNAIVEHPQTKDLYIVDEYHAGNRSFPDHSAAIKAGSPAWQAFQKRPHYFKPGAGGSHQEGGWREAFRSNGLAVDEPPINDVEVGIGCVYGELKSRKLKIFRSCVKTIEQFQLYSREIGPDGQPTDAIANKASYHNLDDVRYILTKLRPPKSLANHFLVAGTRPQPRMVR